MRNFVMIGLVFLAGCSGYTNANDIQIAFQACELNGGLAWVSNSPLNESASSVVKCKNGLKTTVAEYKRHIGDAQ